MRLAVVLLLALSVPAGAQRRPMVAPLWSFEVGAAFGSIYFEEGATSTTVRGTVAPMVGVGALWRAGRVVRAGVVARASRDGLRVTDYTREWNVGHVNRFDMSGTLAWEAERIAFRAVAGPVFLSGPDEIVPFRDRGTAMHWGGGAIIDGTLANKGRLRWRVGADGVWMTPSGTAAPAATGIVPRIVIGAAYAL